MKALMIKDLAVSTELDGEAMASVSGGRYLTPLWGAPSYRSYASFDSHNIDFSADQFVGQQQDVSVVTGLNSAFVDHIQSNVYTDQNASNNINFR